MRRVGWSRHGTGRGGGCARLVGGRQARGEGAGAHGAWVARGRSDGMGQGLVGGTAWELALAQLDTGKRRVPRGGSPLPHGQNRGGRRKKGRVERELEREAGLIINFLQNFELYSEKV